MEGFKRFDTKQSVDLLSYVSEYLIKHPETEIYVSCDSIAKGTNILYALVLILYRKGTGGHILYKKYVEKRNLFGKKAANDYLKLQKEAIHSYELSLWIEENLNRKPDQVGLDYNNDPYYFSNKLLVETIGWFKSNNIHVLGKPNELVSVPDKIVRGLSAR